MTNYKPARIVIIGPSGSGKGTQAELLEKKFGWKHISSGELFRREIKQKTPIGLKVEKLIKKGEFISTKLTFRVLRPVLNQWIDKGFVLDGFPRLPDQPALLDNYLAKKKTKLDVVLYLRVSPKVVIARAKKLWSRGEKFQKGRSDETLAAIHRRLKWSEKTLGKIIDYYRQRNLLAEINGERPVAPIHQQIVGVIERRVFVV